MGVWDTLKGAAGGAVGGFVGSGFNPYGALAGAGLGAGRSMMGGQQNQYDPNDPGGELGGYGDSSGFDWGRLGSGAWDLLKNNPGIAMAGVGALGNRGKREAELQYLQEMIANQQGNRGYQEKQGQMMDLQMQQLQDQMARGRSLDPLARQAMENMMTTMQGGGPVGRMKNYYNEEPQQRLQGGQPFRG